MNTCYTDIRRPAADRVEACIYWGDCGQTQKPTPKDLTAERRRSSGKDSRDTPTQTPEEKRAAAIYSDVLTGAYRCFSHDATLTRFVLQRRSGGASPTPYTVDLSALSCSCPGSTTLRIKNEQDGGRRYCRHIAICWDWVLSPGLLKIAMMATLPANIGVDVPACHGDGREGSGAATYRVWVGSGGGRGYFALRGKSLGDAEAAAEGIRGMYAGSILCVSVRVEAEEYDA